MHEFQSTAVVQRSRLWKKKVQLVSDTTFTIQLLDLVTKVYITVYIAVTNVEP